MFLPVFILTILASRSVQALPGKVLRYFHGLSQTCEVASRVTKFFPDFDIKCISSGNGLLTNFEDQLRIACASLMAEVEVLKGGFTLMGFSNGALVARAVLQECDIGIYVKRLLILGGPQNGVALVPLLDKDLFIHKYIFALCDRPFFRTLLGPCEFAKDFWSQKDPANALARLNNYHFINPKNKARIEGLDLILAMSFESDTVVRPPNSGVFGFYKNEKMDELIELEDTDLYKKDLLGLRKLMQNTRFFRCVLPGDHFNISDEQITKLVVPFADFNDWDYFKYKDFIDVFCRY